MTLEQALKFERNIANAAVAKINELSFPFTLNGKAHTVQAVASRSEINLSAAWVEVSVEMGGVVEGQLLPVGELEGFEYNTYTGYMKLSVVSDHKTGNLHDDLLGALRRHFLQHGVGFGDLLEDTYEFQSWIPKGGGSNTHNEFKVYETELKYYFEITIKSYVFDELTLE